MSSPDRIRALPHGVTMAARNELMRKLYEEGVENLPGTAGQPLGLMPIGVIFGVAASSVHRGVCAAKSARNQSAEQPAATL